MRGTILPIGYGQLFHKWRRKPDTNISFSAGLGVGKGTRHTGSVTPPTISDTDLDRYVLDHEGIWRGVKAEEARFYGARRVENLLAYSEDMVNAGFAADTNASFTASTYTNTGASSRSVYLDSVVAATVVGETYVYSMDVTSDLGGTFNIRGIRGTFASHIAGDILATSTVEFSAGERKRITVAITANTTEALCIYFFDGEDGSVTPQTYTIHSQQIEESTGRLDTTTPSEYVSAGVGTGSELWTGTPDNVDANWTDNGDETYTVTSADAGDPITQDVIYKAGQTLVVSFTIDSISAGSVGPRFEGASDGTLVSSTGSYTEAITLSGAITEAGIKASAGTTATVSNISIKVADHGANVDAVKYFDSDNGNTLTNNVVTDNSGLKYANLPGAAGDYISTPDADALDITGDIDIRARVAMDDWTPNSSTKAFVSKRESGKEAYQFYAKQTSGFLAFSWWNSATIKDAISTAAPTISDGQDLWVRVAHDADNGAGGSDTTFYTSTDGENWTQLGGVVTTAGGTSIDSTTAPLELGSRLLGTASNIAGKIYSVQVYNGIDGTLVAHYDATNDPGINTWTLNGEVAVREHGALLSEYKDTGYATGELITNAGYSGTPGNGSKFVDTTGWTGVDEGSGLSIVSGKLRVTNDDATQSGAVATTATEVGTIYTVFVEQKGNSGGQNTTINVGTTVGGTQIVAAKQLTNSAVNRITFTATTTTSYVMVRPNTGTINAWSDFGSISVVKGIPLSGLLMEGASTNEITQPRDLTNAAWTVGGTSVAALDAVGIDGFPNSASTLTDNDGASAETVSETVTITADSNPVCFSVFIKKDTDVSRFPAFKAQLITGGTQTDERLWLNTSTGAIVGSNVTAAGFSSSGVVDYGEWWLLWAVITNTSNTSAVWTLYPAMGSVIGTIDVAATGSAIFDCAMVEQNRSYPSTPILSTGGVTREADIEATLDLNNWHDAQGTMEFILTPDFDVALAANEGCITPDSSSATRLIFFSSVAKRMVINDGTTFPSLDSAWDVAGQPIRIRIRWNDQTSKMQLDVDGTAVAEATYDGSFSPSGAITLFKSLTYGASMKDLKIYNYDTEFK